MWRNFIRFVREDAGVSSIEYALLGSFIGIFIVTAVSTVGTNLSASYTNIGASFK
jgi:pilus assembly protein Flp/PilA